MTTEADLVSVMALDPGGTTGWALLTVPRRNISNRHQGSVLDDVQLECGQIFGEEHDAIEEIATLVIGHLEAALVIEDFIVRRMDPSREFLSPVRIMTVIEHDCYRLKRPSWRQSPADAKTVVTDDRLKRWGLWTKGQQHARDATRHGILFLRRARSDQALAMKAWPL